MAAGVTASQVGGAAAGVRRVSTLAVGACVAHSHPDLTLQPAHNFHLLLTPPADQHSSPPTLLAVLGRDGAHQHAPSHLPYTHPPLLTLFADEHYFPTLLAVLGRENETACGCWGMAAQDWSAGGAHPKSFV